jgi:hypothetical protein
MSLLGLSTRYRMTAAGRGQGVGQGVVSSSDVAVGLVLPSGPVDKLDIVNNQM